jgi:hypothetical protein
MKRVQLGNLQVSQLAERFVSIALAQHEAIDMDNHSKFNRLYLEMEDVRRELKGRVGDQRRALLPLLNHANAQVRLKAATTLLAIAPERARAALQLINDRKEFPQAADAFGMLRALDAGTYVPT